MMQIKILQKYKRNIYLIIYILFFNTLLFSKPTFPLLTGRVVDSAQILSSIEESNLTSLLKKHEEQSSNQIVIVTITSLEGYDITEYGYLLGRHWGIGQKDKNNGILLIISMNEKKIRIEVGYGLEGSLSDKMAHEIINYIIKPNFRQNNFYNGINEALNAIIKAINGEYTPSDYGIISKNHENWFFLYFAIIFLSGISISIVRKYKNNTISKLFHSSMMAGFGGAFTIGFFNSLIISMIAFFIIALIVFLTTKKVSYSSSSSSSQLGSSNSESFGGGFSSSGGFTNGGFSGSGGSFGGGGASGGW